MEERILPKGTKCLYQGKTICYVKYGGERTLYRVYEEDPDDAFFAFREELIPFAEIDNASMYEQLLKE